MDQTTLTLQGTTHERELPTHSLLGRNLLGLPSHGEVWILKAPEKEKLALCQRTPPAPTMPLSSPGRMGDSPSLNKAFLPHPIHVLCLDFSIWSTKIKIF
jgi:hypothetical protein